MEAVIAVVALLFVLFLAVGAYATVKVVGAARRGMDRTITQARRTVEDTTLRARTIAQPGAVGELAQLRLRLRTSMRATQDSLRAGVAEDSSLHESLTLFQRLSAHGHELDDDLKRLEREPDRIELSQRLPALKERTEQIVKAADSLRWAARDRAHKFADDDLDLLSQQIDMEAGALRHWTAGPSDDQPLTSWSDPAATPKPDQAKTASGSAADLNKPSRPQTADHTAQEPTRPAAITPPTPQPTYPWQKKPKPESTT
ncbi:hypothetical protein [Streptomyces flavofungini]|uniref:Secreted protein n=1 Tax=Streptomyces flavofungini TaxID=68200 RepID=A0ABS0XB08_9ACTN|nr:hypothetical protein [Streptomyces flavofungini]MBJ3810397.1 hypothetical protein [Streptomyces flavofungini]GHC42273.1 hypothetical protein GCM10010349_02980 [Streptomyces flavofungini]